ncbi:cysteine proteinase [Sporormia fimetaria CBS 119925]|uniref:Ubiquitin carboxyl-terminal hydrolase n=1 Tax=Sporormia fimetaria CBS 119925 TaxID=1340428 RepID=A0A6A6VCK2_9PLEO|nr:cysteine proteinase [Sporormia fimetaria CBS 119925]
MLPNGPNQHGRRQQEQQHAPYTGYHGPPQGHPGMQHNPYAQFHHYVPPPVAYAPPTWYQPYYMNPYGPPPQPYAMPPRTFHPQSPVVVSSQPYASPGAPVNRTHGQTPPVVSSQHSSAAAIPPPHLPSPSSALPSAPSFPSAPSAASHPPAFDTLAAAVAQSSVPPVLPTQALPGTSGSVTSTTKAFEGFPVPPVAVSPVPSVPQTFSRTSDPTTSATVAVDASSAPPAKVPQTPSTSSGSPTSTPEPVEAPIQPSLARGRTTLKFDLPWFSAEGPFPGPQNRRRRRRSPVSSKQEGLALPDRSDDPRKESTSAQEAEGKSVQGTTEPAPKKESFPVEPAVPADNTSDGDSTVTGPVIETPSTSHTASQASSPKPTPTPTPSILPPPAGRSHARTATIPAVPLIPIRPAKSASVASTNQKPLKSPTDKEATKKDDATTLPQVQEPEAVQAPKPTTPPKPKSWADLVRTKAAPAVQTPALTNGDIGATRPLTAKGTTRADVLSSFSVLEGSKMAFLEPRGLVNSGNLCYMNSILQVLLFCAPFYTFLEQAAKTAHSFNSDTPLIDAMIMFLQDFKVIDSAESAEKLRMRLKDVELEQYGDPLAPKYVYDVISRLPRFESMTRGQQEDAEEFLGFLLAGLHDECAHIIKSGAQTSTTNGAISPTSERKQSVDGGWLEVGPKQKASITQTSGTIDVESPITKIFGGKLRSEYRKPGEKPSVTLEPYQPLQLDIGSPDVHNISDALRGLTRLETLESAVKGGRPSTKQVFIESLPPVLILHLKRFYYDGSGPHKIWKKIGYPLELEIPKEAFPLHMRGSFAARGGLPRYRLTGVVYHHGKNASGGHYTVDLRRQDGREWIRMDDTVIRRIRSEDVAEGGAEEDPKVLAAALEQHKQDAGSGRTRNFYDFGDDDKKDEGGWSQVNGSDKKDSKKWSGVANGTATPHSTGKRTPVKENVRDNKVAYILLYQRVEA